MKIFRKKLSLKKHLNTIRDQKIKIGIVPTMGSIHYGHLSLIKNAKKNNLYTVTTLFVNPLQFEKKEDFKKYPRNIKSDIKKIKKNKSDVLFLPDITEIYTKNFKVTKSVKKYRNIMCDVYRSNHFDGVTTIVKILFDLIKPDFAFFGEKDFQQLMIIKHLVKINKLPIDVIGCTSIRNKDGLSISSRFNLLNNKEKKILSELGKIIKSSKNNFNRNILISKINKIKINKIEYIDIRSEKTLKRSKKDARVFIALYIGKVKIIDNFKLVG